MLVLNGKKIRYAILGLFGIFLVMAFTMNFNERNSEYINTVSLPVSGKVVVVDARTSEILLNKVK